MIITCPECSKKYSVKTEAIGEKGRTVRCKNCGNSWHQNPPGARATANHDDAMAPDGQSFDHDGAQGSEFNGDQGGGGVDHGYDDPDRLPDPPPIPQQLIHNDDEPAPKKKKGLIGWIILILVLAGIGAGGYFAKDFLVNLWPPIAKVYNMVGLGVPHVGEGLDIQELPPTREQEDGVDVLIVRAKIVNISDQDRELPYLLIELLDPLDRVVQRQKMPLTYDKGAATPATGEGDAPKEKQILPVGESMTVETKIRKPNPTATRLQVTFLDPRKAMTP